MHTPARILRAECDDIPGQRPAPSYREEEKRTRILDCAQRLMANHSRATLRMTDFALAIRMAPQTIRRHFPDLDNLLAQILHRHLATIARALGEVAYDAPNRDRARRAAYLAATRTPFGNPTEAHLLLIRDRHLLPPDEREPLEAHRHSIGDILAGDNAQTALALLDSPDLTAAEIEAALAAITHARHAPAPQAQRAAEPSGANLTPRAAPAAPSHPIPASRATLPDPNSARRPRAGPH